MNAAHIFETFKPAIILALTARQRWGSATKGLNSSNVSIPTWLIISGAAALIVLISSSIIVTYKQKTHKK
jgi:hypothetical protein